ncbi:MULTISPECIES: MoaD/ThiS family protein [Streptomyces]|uniref:MoaD/ThiS family protein n=1 Tax=Streptomyces drozdowiczii TaxID=202862 RepID=A0ABY6Q176_9ACTN|nr:MULTISPECIES: MoaD/ThiS family protein [Streptomyces]MCX0241687.1 MoaD/ThiS family protein [Streptomyces drozdowiczii]OKJ67362.1 thiamine biosynthesis protein ThiS [Streptomyces sp. CB02460]UZK58089.1 MoaD/ThiS family protein [Streptomyces drozdowiczii]
MVKVVLPSVWAADGQTEFEVPAGLLHEVIKRFVADHPSYARRLLGTDHEPAGYINMCVGDALIPRKSRATTVVPEGSTVVLIPPMAGG